MKNLLTTFALFFLMLSAVYIIAAFANTSFYPSEWDKTCKYLICGVGGLIAFGASIGYYSENKS